MNDRTDKIMAIAEELSNTRARVEQTMISLKSLMIGMKESMATSLHELESYGLEADLQRVVDIEEKSRAIARRVRELNQQSASLEQALGYIRSAKKMSSS